MYTNSFFFYGKTAAYCMVDDKKQYFDNSRCRHKVNSSAGDGIIFLSVKFLSMEFAILKDL